MKTITINALEHAIIAMVEEQREHAISLLGELVSHASLLGEEHSAQALVQRIFSDELGLDVQALTIDEALIKDHPGYSPSLVSYDGRVNVIGTHQPAVEQGKSIIFNGHIDVVPVGDERLWTRPPFEAWVEGDKLYGRGASDMKAAIPMAEAEFILSGGNGIKDWGLFHKAAVALGATEGASRVAVDSLFEHPGSTL